MDSVEDYKDIIRNIQRCDFDNLDKYLDDLDVAKQTSIDKIYIFINSGYNLNDIFQLL